MGISKSRKVWSNTFQVRKEHDCQLRQLNTENLSGRVWEERKPSMIQRAKKNNIQQKYYKIEYWKSSTTE